MSKALKPSSSARAADGRRGAQAGEEAWREALRVAERDAEDAASMAAALKKAAEALEAKQVADFPFAKRQEAAPFARMLVTGPLLHHADRDVRLLVSVCAVHVLRLYSPDAPYNDEQVEDVFRLLTTAALPRLDPGVNGGAAAAQRVQALLQVLAETKCAVLLLDLESDDGRAQLRRLIARIRRRRIRKHRFLKLPH